MDYLGIWLLVLVAFAGGWGWGQWQAERTMRQEKSLNEKGRVVVSMPMREDNASQMMGMLQDLIKQAEETNAEPR